MNAVTFVQLESTYIPTSSNYSLAATLKALPIMLDNSISHLHSGNNDMLKTCRSRILFIISYAFLVVLNCSMPRFLYAENAIPNSASSTQATSQDDDEDCMTLGDHFKREMCFSKESNSDLKTCEKLKPNACRPYKDMFFAEKQLTSLNAELLSKVKKHYASYAQDDTNYFSDLERGLADADRSWRAYRDAQCAVNPFLEGMSRTEAGDSTEACRLKQTKAHIKELKGRISSY